MSGQTEKIYKLTDDEINVIGNALANMPFAQVERLIAKIRAQYSEQKLKENKPNGPVEAPTSETTPTKADESKTSV